MKRLGHPIALVALLAAACTSGARDPSADELTIVVRGDRRELEQQEKALREREETLKTEKAALEKRIKDLSEGLKAAADNQQRVRLEEELRHEQDLAEEMSAKESQLTRQKTAVEVKKQVADADTPVAIAALATREAKLAQREAELSQREADVTTREKDLAAREKVLAGLTEQVAQTQAQLVAQLKSAPAAAPQPETGAPPPARDVPRAQLVDQRHKKLLADLAERGILISDFAPEDQPLNAEIWAARRRGDVTRAWDLLADLQKAFSRVKVDRKFVEGKMVRLQGARSSATLSDPQRHEVEKILRDVTSAYSDGKYEQANKGLNRIASILDAAPAPG